MKVRPQAVGLDPDERIEWFWDKSEIQYPGNALFSSLFGMQES